MRKLTARALLVLLLTGILVPVAMAAMQPASHACCARKPMHGSSAQIRDAGCDMRCCGAVSTRIPTAVGQVSSYEAAVQITGSTAIAGSAVHIQPVSVCHSGRAPPAFLLL